MKLNKQILSLQDLFGKTVDEEKMGLRIKEAARWIEKCPMSHLPYVEMGFDALNHDLIMKLDQYADKIHSEYESIKLKCREYENLKPEQLFQENYPYWC